MKRLFGNTFWTTVAVILGAAALIVSAFAAYTPTSITYNVSDKDKTQPTPTYAPTVEPTASPTAALRPARRATTAPSVSPTP